MCFFWLDSNSHNTNHQEHSQSHTHPSIAFTHSKRGSGPTPNVSLSHTDRTWSPTTSNIAPSMAQHPSHSTIRYPLPSNKPNCSTQYFNYWFVIHRHVPYSIRTVGCSLYWESREGGRSGTIQQTTTTTTTDWVGLMVIILEWDIVSGIWEYDDWYRDRDINEQWM